MTMSEQQLNSQGSEMRRAFNAKLAGYLTATGAMTSLAVSRAQADVVGSSSVIPFGVNEEVNIDFNSDGQIDYQIDHDRVNLNGTDLDYLQIDKNDVSSAADPYSIDILTSFPTAPGTENDTFESGYVTSGPGNGFYPSALTYGTPIGPASTFDFSETDNSNGGYLRANRLIDEDMGQIDADAGFTLDPLPGTPNFVGLGGEVRYLGVKMDFGNIDQVHYGWIGIQVTNEADATGNVVGWGYNTTPGVGIAAGIVPEPSSIVLGLFGGAALVGSTLVRRWFRR
jgi:hypothetical protein